MSFLFYFQKKDLFIIHTEIWFLISYYFIVNNRTDYSYILLYGNNILHFWNADRFIAWICLIQKLRQVLIKRYDRGKSEYQRSRSHRFTTWENEKKRNEEVVVTSIWNDKTSQSAFVKRFSCMYIYLLLGIVYVASPISPKDVKCTHTHARRTIWNQKPKKILNIIIS